MKIAIMGAYGFLGTHLTEYYTNKGDNVIKLGRNYDITKAKDSDFLIHCAFIGGKESNTSKEIYKENIQITKTLIGELKKHNLKIPIKYISSIQESNHNSLYGKAKRDTTHILGEYCNDNNIKFENYKLPNLFGTKGKPYYNCFVYTFAYNIVNNLESQYNTNPISLCHVLDAIQVIDNQKVKYKLYHTNVKEVYDRLNNIGSNEFDQKLNEILDYYKSIKQ